MKFKPKVVPVRLLNGDAGVFVREMSWRERKAFEERVGLGKPDVDQGNLPEFAETLVAYSICDQKGTLLYPDIEAVRDLPASVFWALFREAQKLNTLSDETVEAATKN